MVPSCREWKKLCLLEGFISVHQRTDEENNDHIKGIKTNYE
jgi:hypothetical protein